MRLEERIRPDFLTMSRSLRIATYNIHMGRGIDGRVRIERILRVLREIDADVIALQEVVNRRGRSPEENQARYLADELGYSCSVGETRKHRARLLGNVTGIETIIAEAGN